MIFLLIVLFTAMVAVTVWGWLSIPADRRFPLSWGVPPSVEGTVGKRVGLILWLLIGAWFFAISLFAASLDNNLGWAGAALLLFFLAMEYRLIRRLTRPIV